MTPDQWQDHQRANVSAAVAQLMVLWGHVRRDAIGPSWDRLLPRAVDVVTRSQVAAAAGATQYVNDSIAAQVDRPTRVPQLNAEAFAGVASDGRPIESLLTLPATQAGRAAGAGITADAALANGRFSLASLAATQLYDAGRLAVGVGITSHPQAGGYRRQLRGTSCARCVVLAGKWFRWNQGFQRHPRCDCVHVPSVGPKSDYAGAEGFDPQSYFDSLDPAAQDRAFTKAGAQAIRDGADLNQVVNARRGMRTTNMYGRKVATTTVGTSTRSAFGRQLSREGAETVAQGTRNNVRRVRTARLMPETIYAQARDRDDAIRLLRRFGFI